MLDQHLGRAKDVSRGVERDARVAAMHRLRIGQLDGFLREALAEPAGHDRDGVGRRHDFHMSGPGVIGMAMRDDCCRNGPDRVDKEVASLAVKPFGPDLHPFARMTHGVGSGGGGVVGAGTQGSANRFNQNPRRGRLCEHLRIGPIPPQLIDGGISRIEHDTHPSPLQLLGGRENFLIPQADIENGGGHGCRLRQAKGMGQRERGAKNLRPCLLQDYAQVESEDRIVFRDQDPRSLQWLIRYRVHSFRTDFAGKVTVYKRPFDSKSRATFASGKPF